jgi:hypothetical protein
MAMVQGLNQTFVKEKCFTEGIFQKYGFSKQAMNLTTRQKIGEM